MALELEVESNAEDVSAYARKIYEDQLPFATAKAINATALSFQKQQQKHMEDIFTVRRPRFTLRAVKIKPFAYKRRLWARVQIDPPGGRERADILTKFETDRFKVPFSSSRLAVPTENVKRTPTGVVRKRYRISEMNLEPTGTGKVFSQKGRVAVGSVGARTVVAIRKAGGRGGIFMRTRSGESLPLYWFVPRVPIKPELDFVDNATRVVTKEWDDHFFEAFSGAIRNARPRSSVRRARSFTRRRSFSLGLR